MNDHQKYGLMVVAILLFGPVLADLLGDNSGFYTGVGVGVLAAIIAIPILLGRRKNESAN